MATAPRPHTLAPLQGSRARQVGIFLLVVVFGFAAFAAPAIVLQMGLAGGYAGANLALLGVVQLLLAGTVVLVGTRLLGRRPPEIGLRIGRGRRDVLLGLAVAAAWLVLQFGWIFPATGGSQRDDIASILAMVDGQWMNILWYLPLGVLGGGIAEELYNRGFFITTLRDLLGGGRGAAWVAGAASAVFFALGHLPDGWVEWMDILVPSIAYVILFMSTGSLVAPMVAHATWNASVVVLIHLLYG
jgi:uncharacterized protein